MGVTLTMAIGGADMPGNIPILVRDRTGTVQYLLLATHCRRIPQVGVNVGKLRGQCESKLSEESYQQ